MLVFSIASALNRLLLVDNKILANLQVFGANRHLILEITLVFVESVILVDVLYIGNAASTLIHAIGGIFLCKRVALGAIISLITLENRKPLLVIIISSVEVIIIACRVIDRRELIAFHLRDCFGRENITQLVNIVSISWERLLIGSAKAIKTHVLPDAGPRGGFKGIGERRLGRNPTPVSFPNRFGVSVDVWESVLIALESVLEDILTNLAQVDVEITAVLIGIFIVKEGVKQPELDVFNVVSDKIGVVDLAHNTTPSLFGVKQESVSVDVLGVKVIRTALLGIERQVKSLNRRSFSIVKLTSREHLGIRNLPYIGIRQLVEIILNITRSVGRVSLSKQAVDIVPRQERTVLAIIHIIGECSLGEESIVAIVIRCGSEEP